MPASKRLTREEQEQAVMAIVSKPNNSPHMRKYKQPTEKQEIISELPQNFNQIRKHGSGVLTKYGSPPKFTADQLRQELDDLFDFLCSKGIPVNVATVGSWLGVSLETLCQWANDSSNPLSELIKRSRNDIAALRISSGDTGAINPIMSIFTLKAMHGYIETSNVNITAQANIPAQTNPEQVAAEAERQVQRMLSDGTLRA